MVDDRTVREATDLAERLLEEVSRADQDWPAIEHLADALARLAASAARGGRPTRRLSGRHG